MEPKYRVIEEGHILMTLAEEYRLYDFELLPEKVQNGLQVEYDMLTDQQKEALEYWISRVFEYSSRVYAVGSYGLKHHFEREGFYVSDAQFSAAMLKHGFMTHGKSVASQPHKGPRHDLEPFYGGFSFYVKPTHKPHGLERRIGMGEMDIDYASLVQEAKASR